MTPDFLPHVLHAFSSLHFLTFYLPVYAFTFAAAGLLTFLQARSTTAGTGADTSLLAHCLPWTHLASASTKVDFFIYLAAKILGKAINFLSTFVVVVLAARAAAMAGAAWHLDQKLTAGLGDVALICLVLCLCEDLGSYLSHYVQHRVPILWEFHKVHHSATFLTPLTATRFHPVGNMLDGLVIGILLAIPVGVVEILYGFSVAELLAMAAAVNLVCSVLFVNLLQHSHFPIGFGPLDWIFISPRMHQVHHSRKRDHWDKNFGSRFSLWDWCFGTAFRLPKGETLTFGIGTIEDERGDYGRILWCYAGPFVRSAALIKQSFARKVEDSI